MTREELNKRFSELVNSLTSSSELTQVQKVAIAHVWTDKMEDVLLDLYDGRRRAERREESPG